MAIQMRRGAYADLDTSKLVAGELVVATDTGFIGVATSPSHVVELAHQVETKDYIDTKVAMLQDDIDDKVDLGNITISSTDLGEGQPLAAGHFYLVYEV